MSTTTTKFIVACRGRLQEKYQKDFPRVRTIIRTLIDADKKPGIKTSLLFIDEDKSAGAFGLKAVKATTPRECKSAIDALYKKHVPDYIVILGAQDVFPFQLLNNPTDDEDRNVPSDLPYACEHSYSKNIDDFLGPTRVLGRIPDIPDVADIDYLDTIINYAARYEQLAEDHYSRYFAVSAKVWQKSTKKSLLATFGRHDGLQLSPDAAPDGGYLKEDLSALVHFYNCHGALDDYRFWGQRTAGSEIDKVALSSSNLKDNIALGTIVAAECCYGANLFNPAEVTDDGTMSIANNYLLQGALAFMGSSTIAYGPAEGQGQADLITQYFLINVSDGASTGRAMLEARQSFLSKSGPTLDPVDLKTIAQFNLLGDPSVTPVADSLNTAAIQPKNKAIKKGGEDNSNQLAPIVGNTIRNRRKNLLIKGLNLSQGLAGARKMPDEPEDDSYPDEKATTLLKVKPTTKGLSSLLKETGFKACDRASVYTVLNPTNANLTGGSAKGMLKEATRFRTYMKLNTVEPSNPSANERLKHPSKVCNHSVLVVKEDDSNILRWRVYVAR